MVKQMTEQCLSASHAAAAQGVTAPTARKGLGRFLASGVTAQGYASSRPNHSPCSIEPAMAVLIVELRQRRMLQRQIARSVGVCAATVSRVVRRAGLSRA